MVEACWVLVGNAQEYIGKLSVTTSTCLKPPFSSPVTESRWLTVPFAFSLERNGTMVALGESGDYRLMHPFIACYVPVLIFLHTGQAELQAE